MKKLTQVLLKPSVTSVAAVFMLLAGSGAAAQEADKEKKKDPFFTAKISGRVQVDVNSSRAQNVQLEYKDLELRRVDLGIRGSIGDEVTYKITGRLSDNGDINLTDAHVEWEPGGGRVVVRAGQFKTPMSLDESTSSRFGSTLERAAFTDAFEIDRRLGFAIMHTGKRHTVEAGVFVGSLTDSPFSGGTAVSARGTYAPIQKKDQTIHLGGSFRFRDNDIADRGIRYRQRPYNHVANRIISTGRIADSDVFVGAEVAGIYKNFWAAGEFGKTFANCPDCQSDPSFSGYYAEVGAFVGGRKTYKNGSFGRPKVDNPIGKGGLGAFSFVVRYDGLNLNDKDVNGGKLDTWIFGADWWPREDIRISANYFISDAALGNRNSGIGDEFVDLRDNGIFSEKVKGFVFRTQFDF